MTTILKFTEKRSSARRKKPVPLPQNIFAPSNKIEHVVVLMLENRSFDHMLGFMKRLNPEVNGLSGAESCPIDPNNPSSPLIEVTDDAPLRGGLEIDPGHDFNDVAIQLYGHSEPNYEKQPFNNGFIKNYLDSLKLNAAPEAGHKIMQCFAPEKLSVLATLAQEFCVCDSWYASMPGPTWPNRFFVHTGTSGGHVSNNMVLWNAATVFRKLANEDRTWGIFFQDIPQILAIRSLWKSFFARKNFHFMTRFFDMADAGTLPHYSFIEPQYFEFLSSQKKADDQHPMHDVIEGERLISDIYNALRASPKWNSTVFVILYDEHGGIYDHQAPPISAPTKSVSHNPPFNFSRLGVRVPAVIVSPYIPRNTVDHTVYDHTSIIATLGNFLGVNTKYLSQRSRKANTFDHNLCLDLPRTDTPMTVAPANESDRTPSQRHAIYSQPPPHQMQQILSTSEVSTAPLNDLQQQLLGLAHEIDLRETEQVKSYLRAQRIKTEYDAALYVRSRVLKFMDPI